MVSFPTIPSYEGMLRLLLDTPGQPVLRRWRDHENRWAAKSRLMRDLNRRPGIGLQASPGPPSGLRFNPSGFRRRTGHETAPPSRNFTKGLECLEGLESLVLAFYPS